MEEVKYILLLLVGFIFAQFFVDEGMRFFVGAFHFHHLFLGIILMVLSLIASRRYRGAMYIFYFAMGITINDVLLEIGLF